MRSHSSCHQGQEARVSLIICFQDVNGLEALFGEKSARIFREPALQVFSCGRFSRAGKFVSDVFGKKKAPSSRQQTPMALAATRPAGQEDCPASVVMADEVKDLPMPTWAKGIAEGFLSLLHGAHKATVPFRAVVERLRPAGNFPRYTQRPADEQRLKPLTDAKLQASEHPH